MDWIAKPEVVFARTTPSQKLLIVDACQRIGHVVAVTGDGVNDSPAIKKADIGVAMGSGSDVAKGAADILLLTDDFSSITLGVEQGRVMFDNLKKSINYSIAVNIPEMCPPIVYALIQVPMPLSSILMVAICVGTDLAPAISLAYENAELDIMKRPPRHPKLDHLVTAKLLSFAYLQIGELQSYAGMITYFWVLNDYGIKVLSTLFMNQLVGWFPNPTDVYDPNQVNFGNANFGNSNYANTISWGLNFDSHVDIRLFYQTKVPTDWSQCRWDPADESVPRFYRISPWTQAQICYTPEALMYAQTAYFVCAILTQIANNIICRTRYLSLGQHGLDNKYGNISFAFETAIALILLYIPAIEFAISTRALAIPHFMIPAVTFSIMILFYDEARRLYLRRGIRRISGPEGTVMFFDGWIARNTYY